MLLIFWRQKFGSQEKYFCSDHGWPGILHQRGDRHWLIAPEYVSRGIRNIKRIPPLPRPTSTYSQFLFNSSWMTSLTKNLPIKAISKVGIAFLGLTLTWDQVWICCKEINLARCNTCLFIFEMTHLRWFQWWDIAYVALTRSVGWLMIGGGWRYRGNWHLTRLEHSNLPLQRCTLWKW